MHRINDGLRPYWGESNGPLLLRTPKGPRSPPTVPPCPASAHATAFLTIPRVAAGGPQTAAVGANTHRSAAGSDSDGGRPAGTVG